MIFSNQNKRSKKRVWLFVLMTFVLTLIVFNSSVRDFTSKSFVSIASPFLRAGSSVRGWWSDGATSLKMKKDLLMENSELREKNLNLESRLILLEVLEKENEEFKTWFSQINNKEYILGSVISRPPQSPYDTLLVDAGSKQGVKKGAPVTIYENVLLGYVDEVFEGVSRVKLISYPGSEINVLTQGSDLATVAVGKGSSNLEINIPSSIEVKSGDKIIVPGTFPLVLGLVERVELSLSDPFQKIIFRLPFNVQELRHVMIEKI